ncbi:MAG: hypothetical protein ACUVXI_14755 [bacterium]
MNWQRTQEILGHNLRNWIDDAYGTIELVEGLFDIIYSAENYDQFTQMVEEYIEAHQNHYSVDILSQVVNVIMEDGEEEYEFD